MEIDKSFVLIFFFNYLSSVLLSGVQFNCPRFFYDQQNKLIKRLEKVVKIYEKK